MKTIVVWFNGSAQMGHAVFARPDSAECFCNWMKRQFRSAVGDHRMFCSNPDGETWDLVAGNIKFIQDGDTHRLISEAMLKLQQQEQ